MVSFQAPLSELNQRKTISISESNSKKRKYWDDDSQAEEILLCKQWKNPKAAATTTTTTTTTTKSFSDIELHLESPLPSEWQRCLDIQSGEIHFYNTRTQKRTLRDPRESPEPPTSPKNCHMSLDLELNLPCGSLNNNSSSISEKTSMKKRSSNSPPLTSSDHLSMSLSSVRTNSSSDSKTADQSVEMVATACMRCHMLVMLCKASPSCPNCKFMHPPYQTPPDLFKSRLSLSC